MLKVSSRFKVGDMVVAKFSFRRTCVLNDDEIVWDINDVTKEGEIFTIVGFLPPTKSSFSVGEGVVLLGGQCVKLVVDDMNDDLLCGAFDEV